MEKAVDRYLERMAIDIKSLIADCEFGCDALGLLFKNVCRGAEISFTVLILQLRSVILSNDVKTFIYLQNSYSKFTV